MLVPRNEGGRETKWAIVGPSGFLDVPCCFHGGDVSSGRHHSVPRRPRNPAREKGSGSELRGLRVQIHLGIIKTPELRRTRRSPLHSVFALSICTPIAFYCLDGRCSRLGAGQLLSATIN